MLAVDVRFLLTGPDARPPLRSYGADAGTDLPTIEEMCIPAGKAVNLPTGISMEIPPGYWAMIVGRSSASHLMNLIVIPGVIDGGYRGELWLIGELWCVRIGGYDHDWKGYLCEL